MSIQPHPLATLAQIASTRSRQDGVPEEVESDLRVAGCMMIQEAGIMLGLPQSTMATAQVLFHRFFYVSSLASFGVNDISISSLYLSSKLNETPIRLRDLINTYIFLTARIKFLLDLPADAPLPSPLNNAGPSGSAYIQNGKGKEKERDPIWKDFVFDVPGFHDDVFWDWKDIITSSEMQILKRLGFNMQVDLPYNHAINYCKILDLVFTDEVAQLSWSILNDLLLTPNYAIHTPPTLACGSILLTTRLLRIPLPENWYILFDVTWEDIWNVAGSVMVLWHDWGNGVPRGADWGDVGLGRGESQSDRKRKEDRWRRAWVLMQSRRAVRKWLEQRERDLKEETA